MQKKKKKKKKKQKKIHYLNRLFSCVKLYESQFCFEAELHTETVGAGETHLFLQRESRSLTLPGLKSPRLCAMATNQPADQASALLASHIKQGGQGAASLSPYFSALLPAVSQPAWPLSDWIICQPNKNKQDAFCELWAVKTRLGGKYSGLFHHLLIVLFHSPRHRIRRETWPHERIKIKQKHTKQEGKRGRVEEVWKRSGTAMCDTVRMWRARTAPDRIGEVRVCKSLRISLLRHD